MYKGKRPWWKVTYSKPGERGVGTFISDFFKMLYPTVFCAALGICYLYIAFDIFEGNCFPIDNFLGMFFALLIMGCSLVAGYYSIIYIAIGIPSAFLQVIAIYLHKQKFEGIVDNAYEEGEYF